MKKYCFLLLMVPFAALSLVAQPTFTKTFGGEQDEHALAVVQTRDGEYVLAGFTHSYGAGKSDIWVMKLGVDGSEKWRKYYGKSDFDWANTLIETREGNYVLAGYSKDEVTGANNAWILQLDTHGSLMWEKSYGGEKADEIKSIVQTRDGGFALGGFSHSFGKGKSDVWLLRLDPKGDVLWKKTYGGPGVERANSIIETFDGGYILAGFTTSFGNGKADMIMMRTDANGKSLWRKNYGGQGNDVAEVVRETPDGEYLLAGWTASEGQGSLDAKLMRIDGKGKVIWEKIYGDTDKDAIYDLSVTRDGGMIMTGQTSSYGAKASALWILKTNSKGKLQWQKRSNGDKDDYGHAVVQTRDGGYIVAGASKSYTRGGSDMWVMKTNSRGDAAAAPEPELYAQDGRPEEPVAGRNETNASSDPGDIFKPNLYILSIGISDYRDESANLTFAHSDAAAVADQFAKLEGSLFNRVEVRKLLNEDATLVNIKTGISWVERQATQKDMVLIFISSHGALDNKGNLYILPNDFNAYNLFATGLNIKDLTEGMNGTPCKKLILLDACHSGQSGFDLLEFASIKAINLNKIVEELVNKEPGVTVMTSSSGKEYSYENPKWGHGAFTKALLEGLQGSADFNSDQVIRLLELNLYVTERVKELTGGKQHPYTPINLFGDIPLFILDDK